VAPVFLNNRVGLHCGLEKTLLMIIPTLAVNSDKINEPMHKKDNSNIPGVPGADMNAFAIKIIEISNPIPNPILNPLFI
jgi:hypothetical protein